MRKREQAKVLKAILEVRAVQQSAARMEVSRASQALLARRETEANAAAKLHEEQEAWTRCVSDPAGGLMLATVWAREVNRTEASLRRAGEEVQAAEAERSFRSDAWRRALARAEAAETLSQTAATRVRRRAEESRLNELADRTSRQGSRS